MYLQGNGPSGQGECAHTPVVEECACVSNREIFIYLVEDLLKGHFQCVQQICEKEYFIFSSAEFQLFVNT